MAGDRRPLPNLAAIADDASAQWKAAFSQEAQLEGLTSGIADADLLSDAARKRVGALADKPKEIDDLGNDVAAQTHTFFDRKDDDTLPTPDEYQKRIDKFIEVLQGKDGRGGGKGKLAAALAKADTRLEGTLPKALVWALVWIQRTVRLLEQYDHVRDLADVALDASSTTSAPSTGSCWRAG